jgi:hypothetical protein
MANCNAVVAKDMVTTCQAGCYMGAASDTKDASKCEQILSLGGGESLELYYDTCVVDVGTQTNDAAVCNRAKSESYKFTCIATIASSTGDASMCSSLSDPDLRDTCVQGVVQ